MKYYNLIGIQWRRQPKKKWEVRTSFLCWLAVESYNIQNYTCMDPPYIKHFSTDLRKSQEGSEQEWVGPGPPIPPVATPLLTWKIISNTHQLNATNHRSIIWNHQIIINIIVLFFRTGNKNANARTSHCMQKGGLGAGI